MAGESVTGCCERGRIEVRDGGVCDRLSAPVTAGVAAAQFVELVERECTEALSGTAIGMTLPCDSLTPRRRGDLKHQYATFWALYLVDATECALGAAVLGDLLPQHVALLETRECTGTDDAARAVVDSQKHPCALDAAQGGFVAQCREVLAESVRVEGVLSVLAFEYLVLPRREKPGQEVRRAREGRSVECGHSSDDLHVSA